MSRTEEHAAWPLGVGSGCRRGPRRSPPSAPVQLPACPAKIRGMLPCCRGCWHALAARRAGTRPAPVSRAKPPPVAAGSQDGAAQHQRQQWLPGWRGPHWRGGHVAGPHAAWALLLTGGWRHVRSSAESSRLGGGCGQMWAARCDGRISCAPARLPVPQPSCCPAQHTAMPGTAAGSRAGTGAVGAAAGGGKRGGSAAPASGTGPEEMEARLEEATAELLVVREKADR